MGIEIAWSVGVEASGDRIMTTEMIVDLADAVASRGGSASGIGTTAYGATFLVYAEDREKAVANRDLANEHCRRRNCGDQNHRRSGADEPCHRVHRADQDESRRKHRDR